VDRTSDVQQMLDAKSLMCLEASQRDSSHAVCGSYWVVVQSHPQAENWAASNIRRVGYETYLPTLIVQRRDRHTPTILHRVERPLFSGYLFVHVTSPHWSPIRSCYGVRDVLMSGSTPHHLPEATRIAVQAGEALRRLPTPDSVLLRPGAPVRCLYGPFQGIDAVVIAAATNTARIALPMFGAIREVVVPIQQLAVRD